MKYLTLVLVALTLGCASPTTSPAEQIHVIRATHVELKTAAIELINAKVITDQPTKDVIWTVSKEIYDSLNEAEDVLGQDKQQQSLFVIRRARSALTKLSILIANRKKGTSWDPKKSPPSSSQPSTRSPDSTSFTTIGRLDELSLSKMRPGYASKTDLRRAA